MKREPGALSGRWDDTNYLKFIGLYERHQCLWKTDCATYKNRASREEAINTVVEAMGIPDFRVIDCKNKIKNIRSHYCQELKKIKDSKRHSATGEATYEPKLVWFRAVDHFLREYVQIPPAGGTAVTQEDPRRPAEEEGEEEEEDAGNELEETRPPSPASAILSVSGSTDLFGVSGRNREERRHKRRRVASDALGDCNPGEEATGLAVTVDRKESEFEAFGRSVAVQLSNMPYVEALRLQLNVQTLITEERIKLLRNSLD